MVQRERHSGALLDSVGRGSRLRIDTLPGALGRVAQRCSCAERSRQCRRQWQRQRPHQLHERSDDRHAISPGRGPSGPSIDQIIAAKIGGDSRFRSLQIGVAQESFGESMQRNMSWAGYERALPPEMIPHRLFDRLFGAREEGWANRKRSILDTVTADASALQKTLPADDKTRVDEHLSGIRDLERAIAGLPAGIRARGSAGF